jgi:hypothetical protein
MYCGPRDSNPSTAGSLVDCLLGLLTERIGVETSLDGTLESVRYVAHTFFVCRVGTRADARPQPFQ